MKTSRTLIAAAAAAALGIAGYAHATTPYDPSVDPSEDMEHDTDGYIPGVSPGSAPAFTFDPLNDPALAGDTPGAGPLDPPHPENVGGGADWLDIRTGGVGVIEEVPNGHGGVLSPVGSYLGHLATPHSAGNHAIVQFEGGDGPFGRTNRQRLTKPTPTVGTYVGGRTGYWATSDLYIEPGHTSNANGIPDFWWTNAVNRSDTTTYFTESGMTGTVNPDGSWAIHTTSGVLIVPSVPAGSWIGLEVEPKVSATIPGGVDFEHRVYADGGTHTALIGSVTLPEYTATVGGFALLTGPRYNWYTFPDGNLPYILADNIGWASVPEPAALSLLGLGALGLARRTRRQA